MSARAQRIEAITALLLSLDEDPLREGLLRTPERVAAAWDEWSSGKGVKADDVLTTTFTDGAERADEMIVVRKVPFYSHCEHHLAPFFGYVDVGYLPNGKIVGLSKIVRWVEACSRRLQVQERLTSDIATGIRDVLEAKGVGVVVHARHLCMESRGIKTAGCETVTSSMLESFRYDPTVRAEFLRLIDR